MEEIQKEINTEVNIEEQDVAQPQKSFTQDEVNKIVQDRLTKERTKYEKNVEVSNKEQDITSREKDLNTRILKLDAINTLKEKGMPIELLELLSFNSKEELDSKINLYHTIFTTMVSEEVTRRIPSYDPEGGTSVVNDGGTSDKALREAMKLLK